jgi:hypothetical protein
MKLVLMSWERGTLGNGDSNSLSMWLDVMSMSVRGVYPTALASSMKDCAE